MDLMIAANPMGSGEILSEVRKALIERLGRPVIHEAPRSTASDIFRIMDEMRQEK